MNRFTQMTALIAAIGVCSCAFAAEGFSGYWSKLFCPQTDQDDWVGAYCPDDYCPKSLPADCGVSRFCPDDYQAKCLPCAEPVSEFCCDDYCRKCLPPISCPSGRDLKCPAPADCCCPSCSAADADGRPFRWRLDNLQPKWMSRLLRRPFD